MRYAPLMVSFAMLAILAGSAAGQVVSLTGAGPVQLGMTVAAAERSLGAKLAPAREPFSEDCFITSRADGRDSPISYVFQHGKLVRIDFAPQHREKLALKTAVGIGIGSSEADVRRVYKDITVTRANYEDEESEIEFAKERAKTGVTAPQESPRYWLRVDSPNHQRGMIFVTQDGKVTSFFVGYKPAIETLENCL